MQVKSINHREIQMKIFSDNSPTFFFFIFIENNTQFFDEHINKKKFAIRFESMRFKFMNEIVLRSKI